MLSPISLIDRFASNPTEENITELIAAIEKHPTDVNLICTLAETLANSGEKLTTKQMCADIPSTGGPSSLSTLICPLILVEQGFEVPKLGIVGRPAGGIDCLYQIEGYQIDFSIKEIEACIETFPYCHFLVGNEFAPLDLKLFEYRSNHGKKSVPALVIASILSKKLAAGIRTVGLDIRVGEFGNFGKSMIEAEENALLFNAVAQGLGINSTCF